MGADSSRQAFRKSFFYLWVFQEYFYEILSRLKLTSKVCIIWLIAGNWGIEDCQFLSVDIGRHSLEDFTDDFAAGMSRQNNRGIRCSEVPFAKYVANTRGWAFQFRVWFHWWRSHER